MVEDCQLYEKWIERLHKQRRSKILRCKNACDRDRSLMAGILLRYALEKAGYDYEHLRFGVTKAGRPVIESEESLFYSISHSGDYVVCLLADCNVGVDIESATRRLFQKGKEAQLERVAKHSFSQKEYEEYLLADDGKKKEIFLKYWTRKESYSKALGIGLTMDFSSIEVPEEYYLSRWLLEDYYISIYTEKGKNEIMYDELTIRDIQKMEEEIEHRKLVVRKQALEDVKEARAHGDLSENFEYKAAKKFKNENESRIRYLEKMIKTAHIISEESAEDEVGMNNTVEIYFEEDDEVEIYKLVTTVRSNSLKNLISKDSPLGSAIFGHKVGDRCEVKVNDTYSYYVKILRIENTVDDGTDALRKF